MQTEQLRNCLDSFDDARVLLQSWRVRDPERGWSNVRYLAGHLTADGVLELIPPLTRLLPRCPDADMALNNLERFLANPAGRELLPAMLDNRARTLEILLQIFSSSQSFSDMLVTHPDYLDMLRVPLRRSPGPA